MARYPLYIFHGAYRHVAFLGIKRLYGTIYHFSLNLNWDTLMHTWQVVINNA